MTSHRDLASGVLEQAKKDLRRFYGSTTGLERELYLDAYRWIMSDDCTWPFSFVNVCDFMGLTPVHLRQEVIGDQPLSAFRYGMRRCGRIASRLQSSLTQLFTNERNTGAKVCLLTHRMPTT